MRSSAIGLLLLLSACAPMPEKPNVVVVTFDTTRADRIGCYGDSAASTPNLDDLARTGVLFENAVAPVPITLPSHSSLMTGKIPPAHGVRDNGTFVLGDDQVTLAEVLADAGYRTAAAIGAYPLKEEFGIAQGFEYFDDHVGGQYEDVFGDRVFPKEQLFFDERPAGQVNAAVIPWLQDHHDEPFLVWLHYFDPHHPHQPPPPHGHLYVHDLYAGEIAYADESLGMLLQQLERLGVRDRTIVIFTADHGEGLGEHQESTHSLLVYNSTIHVPLIVSGPGIVKNHRVNDRVGLVDVVPTVLDLIGLDPVPGIQGRSLRAELEGATSTGFGDRPYYAETLSPRLARGWGDLRALFRGDYKYIHGPRPEFFNLADDPHELHDLMVERQEPAAALRRDLERYLDDHAIHGLDASVALDPETADRLAALGYLQSAGEAVGVIREELRDDGDPPQDHAWTVSIYSHAKQLLFREESLEAMVYIRELLETDGDNPEYLELKAKAQLQTGQSREALDTLNQIVSKGSSHQDPIRIVRLIAEILTRQGDLEAATRRYREAETVEMTPLGQYRLAKIAEHQGRFDLVVEHLEAALAVDPTFVPARVNLGIWFAQRGRIDDAEVQFVRVIEDHPYFDRGFFNYGVFLVQQDRHGEALRQFDRVVELNPAHLAAHSALVELLVMAGRRDEALDHYRIIANRAPGSVEAMTAQELVGG